MSSISTLVTNLKTPCLFPFRLYLCCSCLYLRSAGKYFGSFLCVSLRGNPYADVCALLYHRAFSQIVYLKTVSDAEEIMVAVT